MTAINAFVPATRASTPRVGAARGSHALVPIAPAVRRLGWLIAGLAVAGFAALQIMRHDLGLAPIVFLILPDLAFLVGLGDAHEPRQMPARAVPPYNLLHQPLLPLALIGVLSFVDLGLVLFTGALMWFAHIALDRAAGYGQRTPDGWQRV